MSEQSKSILTATLLKEIATHLSSREDCKKVNYSVQISNNLITFEPVRKVCPNRYRRCDRDKVDIITHVIKEHFPELVMSVKDNLVIEVDTTKLVEGHYTYQSSIDHKRRRWIRIK